jgi:hypothetical protein
VRRCNLPCRGVKEERRKSRDPGETGAIEFAEVVGDVYDIRIEPAFMPAIKSVALRLNPCEQMLDAITGPGRVGGFRRLLEIENCPVVRLQSRCRTSFGSGNLYEMANVADGETGSPASAGILHVDCDRLGDTAANNGPAEGRATAHLLGHCEYS